LSPEHRAYRRWYRRELSMLFFGQSVHRDDLKELDGEEDDGFFAKRSSKYADEMCQADTFDRNAKEFEQLRQRLEQDGMKFSLAKCCLYMPCIFESSMGSGTTGFHD